MLNDLDRLLGKQARISIYTMEDLTSYYRDFYTISNFLISKGYTSLIEQAKSFYRGFQPQLWSKVQNHLYTSDPKHDVNKPWELPLLFEAAKLIINLGNTGGPASSHPSFATTILQPLTGPTQQYIPPILLSKATSPPITILKVPEPVIKMEDFMGMLDCYTM